MAKLYFKTAPEPEAEDDWCKGCCAEDDKDLCIRLTAASYKKYNIGCGGRSVIFKLVKRED